MKTHTAKGWYDIRAVIHLRHLLVHRSPILECLVDQGAALANIRHSHRRAIRGRGASLSPRGRSTQDDSAFVVEAVVVDHMAAAVEVVPPPTTPADAARDEADDEDDDEECECDPEEDDSHERPLRATRFSARATPPRLQLCLGRGAMDHWKRRGLC